MGQLDGVDQLGHGRQSSAIRRICHTGWTKRRETGIRDHPLSHLKRLIFAVIVAGVLSVVVGTAAANDDHGTDEWPTTCVDLNDIVEEHLGNPHNVRIYQNTFGDQAEVACQNDHRNDVIAVFGWAIATESSASGSHLELDWPTTLYVDFGT